MQVNSGVRLSHSLDSAIRDAYGTRGDSSGGCPSGPGSHPGAKRSRDLILEVLVQVLLAVERKGHRRMAAPARTCAPAPGHESRSGGYGHLGMWRFRRVDGPQAPIEPLQANALGDSPGAPCRSKPQRLARARLESIGSDVRIMLPLHRTQPAHALTMCGDDVSQASRAMTSPSGATP